MNIIDEIQVCENGEALLWDEQWKSTYVLGHQFRPAKSQMLEWF